MCVGMKDMLYFLFLAELSYYKTHPHVSPFCHKFVSPPLLSLSRAAMEAERLQYYLSLSFFSFSAAFLFLSFLLKLLPLRSSWCCSCAVCDTYVTTSWAADFDNLCDWYTHLLRRSPTRTIHVHVLGNTITANPDNVEYMLKTNFDNFPKGKPFAAILGDLLGRGIFNADGEHWHFQRKMAAAKLGSSSVRVFAACVIAAEVRTRLLSLLDAACDGGSVLDLQDVFRRFAFDNICKISFGIDPGCLELSLPISEFANAFDTATRLSACRATSTVPAVWKAKRLFNWGTERELRESINLLNMLAVEVIRQRRKLGFSLNHDLLSQFMNCVDDDDEYLRDIVVSFLLAGRDTVASALTSLFMLLSRHPDVCATMRDEIERTAADGEATSYGKLREMHYVHAVVYEAMRLYPPVQFDSKFCLEDDVLPDGTFVRRGTRVTYHPYAMGRMEEAWGADCEQFRPERWLKNGEFSPENPYKYPVFQGGPRTCLGKEMALMEVKTVAVAVVRRYDVNVLDAKKPPKFSLGLTASLRGGLPSRIRRRTEDSRGAAAGGESLAIGAC